MVDEVRRDPVTGDKVIVRRGGGSGLLILLLILVALAALAYFTGFINVNGGKAPTLVGGQAPTIETGKIVVGTKKEVVDTPTLGVQKADDAKK